MELRSVGIDLGKTLFHLVGLNPRGEVVVRRKFSRKQLLHFSLFSFAARCWRSVHSRPPQPMKKRKYCDAFALGFVPK